MRRLSTLIDPETPSRVHRVVDIEELATEWREDLRFLVQVTGTSLARVDTLKKAGLRNVGWVDGKELLPGDIVIPEADKGRATVLYRESDVHHGMLLTNRCNSYCLMCSQPPTKANDDWLVEQALDVIRHFRKAPRVLGLSGGEPLLVSGGLRRILGDLHCLHPETYVEVLTNGRLLSKPSVVEEVLNGLETKVHWLVPLYGHADFLHDFVVQSTGAFDETLAGLLALQEHEQPVQLRIVLIEPVLSRLEALCSFIGRNLPFVHEVALMACEPIGFALANREQCEVDLLEWADTLASASRALRRHAVPHLIMNAPLCALPETLWPLARKSISDWKNTYVEECNRCTVKAECCGLFAWHERGWKPTRIRAIEGVTA